jgi:hypothetical protein
MISYLFVVLFLRKQREKSKICVYLQREKSRKRRKTGIEKSRKRDN